MDGSRDSVLVLTNPSDATADLVLRLLAERRVPVVRLDPGVDLHDGSSLTATYRTGDQRSTLRTPRRELDLTRVRSVWVRRPSPYGGAPGLSGQARKFSAEQSYWGTGGILASLPGALYVNHPWSNRAAEYKPAQLATAQRSGFLVPHTLITDNEDDAREFAAGERGGVVYKPVWNTPYRVDGQPHSVWVREARSHEITHAVAVCPYMFQAKVDKVFDVRVTAVGDRLSGTRIDSSDRDRGYRRYRPNFTQCTPIRIPEAVEHSVAAYLAEFRLTFGAFDFAVTADDTWYFLECNPNGQWAWQPTGTTDFVARAIADQLQKGI
ncbi:ATP-grasp ribosomal peptide maturase [Streptomyces sp. NBC_01387]|uniref:ATP-grasp ribosomal peptide maturase n=1 Tax=unclassified Streptomyces TaxID=2593676 RepID=UPI002023C81B|nr:ATP-grasp ribosomal peptide maturase [Streptomyces sp. A 4/2]